MKISITRLGWRMMNVDERSVGIHKPPDSAITKEVSAINRFQLLLSFSKRFVECRWDDET